MVRNCVIDDCRESDLTILTHRFPKAAESTELWRKNLNLQNFSIDDLQKRYVVCTRHFPASSYRNPTSACLNTNALPNLFKNEDNIRIHQKKTRNETPVKYIAAKKPRVEVQQQQSSFVVMNRLLPQPMIKSEPRLELKKVLSNYKKIASNATVTPFTQRDEQPTVVIADEDDNVEYEEVIEGNFSNEVEIDNEPVEEQFEVYEDEYENLPMHTFNTAVATAESATQTEDRDDASSVVSTESGQDTKDDKLIRILYPEFAGMTKMKLVEVVNEKNQRIQSLEERIAKLEAAMRELL